MTILKNYWVLIVRSILITAGVLWLPLEAYEGLDNTDASVTFGWFVGLVCRNLVYTVVGFGRGTYVFGRWRRLVDL